MRLHPGGSWGSGGGLRGAGSGPCCSGQPQLRALEVMLQSGLHRSALLSAGDPLCGLELQTLNRQENLCCVSSLSDFLCIWFQIAAPDELPGAPAACAGGLDEPGGALGVHRCGPSQTCWCLSVHQPHQTALFLPWICSVLSLSLVPQVPFLSHVLVTQEVACGGRSAVPRASVNTDSTSGHPHPSVLAGAGISPCSSFRGFLCSLRVLLAGDRVPVRFGAPPAASLSLPSSRDPRAAHEDTAITALLPARRCRGVAGAGPGGTGDVMWQSVTQRPGQPLSAAAFCAVQAFPSHSF